MSKPWSGKEAEVVALLNGSKSLICAGVLNDDARLIAAAPDLLAACEALLETVEAQYRHGIRWDPAQVDAARAAIARTKTGEA